MLWVLWLQQGMFYFLSLYILSFYEFKCTYLNFEFFLFLTKVIHPKYYKHLKKKDPIKAIWADKKWDGFWKISLYIK